MKTRKQLIEELNKANMLICEYDDEARSIKSIKNSNKAYKGANTKLKKKIEDQKEFCTDSLGGIEWKNEQIKGLKGYRNKTECILEKQDEVIRKGVTLVNWLLLQIIFMGIVIGGFIYYIAK